MYLEIGNGQRIDDPTPEQISNHLRMLPHDAPILILNADEEHFIQATPAGGRLRVEWRQEHEQRFMQVSIEEAEAAFHAFQRWDERALAAFPWQRLTIWIDPYRRPIFFLILMVVGLLVLWFTVRKFVE